MSFTGKGKTGVCIIALIYLCCLTCSKAYDPGTKTPPDNVKLTVDSVTATFNAATGNVMVTWGTTGDAGNGIIGYSIYREWLDTSSENSFSKPIIRVGMVNTYLDPPGVGNGIYFYKVAKIIAVLNAKGTMDSVEGEKSVADTCYVRSGSGSVGAIKINDGAAYTVTPRVRVTLEYANLYSRYNVYPDKAGLDTTTNPLKTVTLLPGTDISIDTCMLASGGGLKMLYMNAYNDSANRWDTLSSFIKIQSAMAKISVRNSDLLRRQVGNTLVLNTTAQKDITFEMRVFGDTTFAPDVYVWLATPADAHHKLETEPSTHAWMETKPKMYSLNFNMINMTRDENALYIYKVDFDSICIAPNKNNVGNRRKGSYWGGALQTAAQLPTSPDTVFALSRAARWDAGRKEFLLIVQMKGRFFGEERYYLSRTVTTTETFWELYPPCVQFETQKLVTPLERDTVNSAFDFLLNQQISIKDLMCKPSKIQLYFTLLPDSLVNTIKDSVFEDMTPTVQARPARPAGAFLEKFPNGYKLDTATVRKYRHVVFDYDFTTEVYYVMNVKWEGINPVRPGFEWISGFYAVSVIARDELGNEGFAVAEIPALSNAKDYYIKKNPRIINIQTGK